MVDVIRDRFASGLVGGLIGGTVMAAMSLANVYLIHFARVPYFQWSAGILYNGRADNAMEMALAQVAQIGFAGGLGVVYAYILPKVTSRNYRLKGIFFGVASWFILYALAVTFKLSSITKIHLDTALSNLITAAIYGWILSEFLRWSDKKYEEME